MITEASAIALFGTTDVIGMTFDATFYGVTQEMRIVGIRQDSASSLINMGSGMDKMVTAEAPLTFVGNKYGFYIDDTEEFYVMADSTENSVEVAGEVLNLMETRHNVRGENQIMMQSFTDVSSQFDTILGFITIFISFVAAISLLVGGIGVMNIMLVSVTERTREIGIRKALGAKNKSIRRQFMTEAVVICLMGGVIGIVIGILNGFLLSQVAGMLVSSYEQELGSMLHVTVSPSITAIIISVVFSMLIGVVFGYYPAKRAANMSPIDALRYE